MQENIRQKALKLFQQGQHSKARNFYEKMYQKNPQDAEVLYMLGSIHGQMGKYQRAIDFFNKTLQLQPNAFVAICGLGAAHKQLGEYADAEKIFQQALKFQPGNIDLLLELAGLYLLQNNIDEAESVLKKIISSSSTNAEALHGLGEVSHSRQQLDFAEDYYRQALAIQPERANTHNRLGYINHRKGFLEPAIQHYKKAVSIEPGNPDFWKNLSQAQLLNGQIDESLESINRCIKSNPNDIDAVAAKANIYEKLGDIDNAYKMIKPALDKKILHAGIAHIYISICRKLNLCTGAIEYLEATLKQTGIPSTTLAMIHYEAGKLFDKLGDYDRAFGHYETANKLSPASFRADEHTARIDEIMRVFDWSFLATAPRASSDDSGCPIFIVGMPRSGTSLTEQILDSHADVTGVGELPDIGNIAVEMANAINANKSFPQSYREVTSEILEHFAGEYLDKLNSISTNSRYVSDKMPQNFFHLGLISLLFPKAKIIHCTRNPVDTCLSVYFQNFSESHNYATRLENVAYYYNEYHRLMDHWKLTIPTTIFDLKYSELVNHPEETIRKLVEFIGLDWDDNCLEFHKSKRHVPTSSYNQVTKQMYTSSLHRWKNYEKHIEPLINKLESLGIDLSKYN